MFHQVPQLSVGSIEKIFGSTKFQKPIILQVLKLELASSSNSTLKYHHGLVSDARHTHKFGLKCKALNDMVTTGKILNYTLVEVKKARISTLHRGESGASNIIIIEDMTVIHRSCSFCVEIGLPQPFTSEVLPLPPQNVPERMSRKILQSPTEEHQQLNSQLHPTAEHKCTKTYTVKAATPRRTVLICNVNIYTNHWVIRAHVMSKTTIKTCHKSVGCKEFFSVMLKDNSGDIRATAYGENVSWLHDYLEVGAIFYIENCSVKLVSNSFARFKHECELSFTATSNIEKCTDYPM